MAGPIVISVLTKSQKAVLGVGALVGAIGGIAASAVKVEAEFSKSMRLVAANTGATTQQLQQLQDAAVTLGPKLGFGARESADAVLELAKAGLTAKQIIGGGLKGTLVLAAAGGTSLANASTIASNALNSFGLKAGQMGQIASALAGAANASTASVESLGQALSQVGPGARTAGLNLQETVATLAAFDNAGIKGSDAGTSLKTMLARLVPQTKKTRQAMSNLGLDFVKADGSFESITNIAEQLKTKLGSLSAAQKTTALTTIFGSDATRAATVLAREGAAGLQKYIRAAKDSSAAQKAVKANTTGTSGAIARFKAAIEVAQLRLGQALAPVLLLVANLLIDKIVPATQATIGFLIQFASAAKERLAPVVEALRENFAVLLEKLQPVGDFLRDNPTAIKGAAIALGIAAAATLALSAAMAVLAIATSPVTLTVLAIAALGAGLALAYQRSETFRTAVQVVGAYLRDSLLPALQQFGGYLVNTVVPAVVRVAQAVGARLKPILEQLVETFRARIAPTVANAVAKFRDMWPAIQRIATAVIKAGAEFLKFAAAVAGRVLPIVIRFGGFLFATLVPALVSVIGVIVRVVDNAIRMGVAFFNAAKKVADFARRVVEKVTEVITTVATLPGRAVAAIGNLSGLLAQAGRDLIQGFINGIGDMFDDVQSKLGDLTGKLTSWKGPPEKDIRLLRPAGRLLMKGLIRGIDDGATGVEKTLGKITDLIKKTINARIKDNGKAAAVIRARLKGLRDEYAALTKNGKAQDKNTQALDKAVANLKRLRQEAAQYAASIKDSFVSYGSVVGLGQQDDGSVSTGGLLDELRDRLARAQRFASLIRQLATKLNPTTLQQLIDAGVDGGLATAEAIAAGGTSAIQQINDLTKQIGATGSAFGSAMSKQFKSAGIAAAQSVVAGLKAQQAQLDRIATRLANVLVAQVKKALGIKGNGGGNAGAGAAAAAGSRTMVVQVELTGQAQSDLQQGRRVTTTTNVSRAAGVRVLALGGAG